MSAIVVDGKVRVVLLLLCQDADILVEENRGGSVGRCMTVELLASN